MNYDPDLLPTLSDDGVWVEYPNGQKVPAESWSSDAEAFIAKVNGPEPGTVTLAVSRRTAHWLTVMGTSSIPDVEVDAIADAARRALAGEEGQ